MEDTIRILDMSANKLEYLTEDISFLRYFPILYSGIKFFTRNLKSLFLNQNRLVGLPDEIGKQRMITQHIQLRAELSWKWNDLQAESKARFISDHIKYKKSFYETLDMPTC